MKVFCFLIFLNFNFFNFSHQCDFNYGPEGETRCILFEKSVRKYQFATCLPNNYIRLKTKNRHFCENQNATFCLYSCMEDKYGIDSGDVFEDCLCNRGIKTSDTIFIKVICLFIFLYNFLGVFCS